MYNSFMNSLELNSIGFKSLGINVLISKNAVFYNPELLEIGNNVRIDDFVTISGKVVLRDYIHIAQFCSMYGGTEGIYMDSFSGLSSKSIIYATSNDYSGESLTNPMVPNKYKMSDINKKVVIGKHVVIGCMSVILPGVEIEEGCAVGAMSLVNKSIGDYGIYCGIPVKRIKNRSKKVFELESQFLIE